ncbi:unnamed protein product [Darwinula stevensoni]|uniref:Uncharacterized protein n=1 Tax=Darwinula stevensoni TaxID=69355 RepID=A0A7R9AAP3_9CRUS|nr:unnamed protein product [Darwinula stevensoni]CAG0898422.1 unnamed protein product [Darwinula stevensoni]
MSAHDEDLLNFEEDDDEVLDLDAEEENALLAIDEDATYGEEDDILEVSEEQYHSLQDEAHLAYSEEDGNASVARVQAPAEAQVGLSEASDEQHKDTSKWEEEDEEEDDDDDDRHRRNRRFESERKLDSVNPATTTTELIPESLDSVKVTAKPPTAKAPTSGAPPPRQSQTPRGRGRGNRGGGWGREPRHGQWNRQAQENKFMNIPVWDPPPQQHHPGPGIGNIHINPRFHRDMRDQGGMVRDGMLPFDFPQPQLPMHSHMPPPTSQFSDFANFPPVMPNSFQQGFGMHSNFDPPPMVRPMITTQQQQGSRLIGPNQGGTPQRPPAGQIFSSLHFINAAVERIPNEV